MRPDSRGPLDKKLIALLSFVRAKVIVQVAVLKTQPVKFAQIPGQVRRIAEGPLVPVIDHGSVIEEKSGRPISIELELGITVTAVRPLAPPDGLRF